MALRSVVRAWGTALIFTERFFRQAAPRTGYGGTSVGLVAVLHVVGYYVTLVAGAGIASVSRGPHTFVENLADLGGPTLLVGLVFGGLVVVNWLAVSGVLHAAVKLRHGDGTFGDTLFVVGWSSPVALVVLLFWGVGLLLAVSESSLVMSYDAHVDTAAPAARVAGFAGGFVALVWQGHVWAEGLQDAHGVERDAAVQAAVLTVALGFVALVATA